ncbi:TIM44-like domain-containing protein [Hydrogenophaga sp.]|uniref:Tim44 domain-containing protein n=1 Tax=Hydrogenophaga sp. TaxID=1904254 RepID=UPI002C79DEF0|nr:TIM44-like domain-containing protein [Hydrogenophaga sp.]HMP10279.1 TIM44-like domain-containing protein [Hydrogenophaga sp.]
MKKLFSLFAVVLSLGLAAVSFDAEARRLGGGGSLGVQRQAAPPRAPATTPRQAPNNATPPATTPQRSWMGPVAGLAAGLGLAALAHHLGFGEAFANMLMIGLLVVAAIAIIGFIMRRKAGAQNGGMAYAGAQAGLGAAQPSAFRMQTPPVAAGPAAPPAGGSMIGANLQPPVSHIPADFDTASFARNAKVQFIRLQAAHDAGNLEDIREFTTPQMFGEISMDIRDRGQAPSQTDVVSLDAEVIDVQEEGHQYVVSVRFTGTIREDGGAAEAFEETWHLTKPVQGSGGWVLAGIQQSV